ncbi:hypothetical protein [Spiroplasma platyhelix]|uniref:Transmembrane protein n=1 Tax=Spiroplasma platyhelix PALS-1 TaxID=1276218 RepID=A0A846UCJ2_9MOLU|nr:hypothetical protein [Spiroplasma platyhelix]MBE4703865.1 hypothetical protein [Spiroplasma platyhelix PALS-1]NKE38238.1 hypothetical protein [Spiroplasma platyhelix PALS-1]UJB29123.1 hypothetical protein SPLAT_v1c03590 [Spiroplasma platyhelix PALS-1]
MNQKTINKVLKNNWKIIANKYLLKTILWSTLTVALIVFSVVIRVHPDWFETLLKWDFFNNGMNFVDPKFSQENLILIETYLYMAILASAIANIGLILIEIKIIRKRYIEAKYQIFSNVNNNYFIFKNLLFVSISQNITYIFCFTNAITFIFVLIYFLIYFIIDNILDKNFKFTKEEITTKWWDNNEQKSTITILAIEVSYFLLKNILKSSSINIDIDQILKYFIPASSLALIIGIFVQSLVKNNVKKILSNMNNAPTKANDFNIFYKLEGKNVLTNYEFIRTMPTVIKNKVKENNGDKESVMKLVDQISQLIDTLEKNKKAKRIKENELNYLIYHIFYEIKTEAELDQISKKVLAKRKGE